MKRFLPSALTILAVTAMPLTWHAVAQIADDPVITLSETNSDVSRPAGEARRDVLNRIASTLQTVQTAQGRFGQTNPDYTFVEGSFALQRPGRIRFDYDAPSPLLIVSDGSTVAIEDRDLETFDRVPIGRTPLKLILGSGLDFEKDANVQDLLISDSGIFLTLTDAKGETEGQITMVLNPETYQLEGWRVIDGSGNLTTVQLEDAKLNPKLSQRLFRIEDPEDEEDD